MAEPVFPEMKCFVLMPTGLRKEYSKGQREAEYVYQKIILPALERCGIAASEVVREVDKREGGPINRAIVQRLFEAPFVIVDITGHNANVFLN